MKRIITLAAICSIFCMSAKAQEITPVAEATDSIATVSADGLNVDGSIQKYRRSSLYSVVIKHPTFSYGEAIDSAFFAMPMPDKFNDHNLAFRRIESSADKMKKGGKKKDSVNESDINSFIQDNDVARQLVAKWFDRKDDGSFDLELIQERGFYDANQLDIEAAKLDEYRGIAALGDAGEELIGKTFMIVNDITFVDKGEKSAKAAGVLSVLGRVGAAVTGSDAIAQVGDMVAAGVNEIDGFSVNITTYLYKLVWNDDVMNTFYMEHWFDSNASDADKAAKVKAFNDSNIYKLQYVGQTTTSAQNTSSKSFAKRSKEEQMLKTCARAVDKAIVELQREYDEFKVNTPISKINEDNTVEVPVGLKEGVTEKCRYEVLEAKADADGHITYHRVGLLAPVKGKIWDNRYGALDDALADENAGEADAAADNGKKAKDEDSNSEEDGNALLKATTFKVLEGGNKIMAGSLVRECRIK